MAPQVMQMQVMPLPQPKPTIMTFPMIRPVLLQPQPILPSPIPVQQIYAPEVFDFVGQGLDQGKGIIL